MGTVLPRKTPVGLVQERQQVLLADDLSWSSPQKPEGDPGEMGLIEVARLEGSVGDGPAFAQEPCPPPCPLVRGEGTALFRQREGFRARTLPVPRIRQFSVARPNPGP